MAYGPNLTYINQACARGLGCGCQDEVEIMGEELENVTQNFVLPSTDISRDGEALLVQPWQMLKSVQSAVFAKRDAR